MDQERKPRKRLFIRELVPDWRPAREQALRSIKIAVFVVVALLGVLLLLYAISLLFGVKLMNLLKVLAVPITIGAAVPLLNWLQKKRELDVEHQRAQDEALQAYLDQMGQLLLDKDRPLRRPEEDCEVRTLARARTLTILARLDSLWCEMGQQTATGISALPSLFGLWSASSITAPPTSGLWYRDWPSAPPNPPICRSLPRLYPGNGPDVPAAS